MSDTEDQVENQEPEGLQHALQHLKSVSDVDDIEEYNRQRKEEKEREAREIEELKQKREQRKKERVEEEKRLAEQRKEEDARRKQEEEDRKRKKQEEEDKRRAEREKKRKEAEKKKAPKKPNFKIVKREGGIEELVEEEAPKSYQKTKEELEKAKQAALAQRIKPLDLKDDTSVEDLMDLAKSLDSQIRQLISNQYVLEEQYKRQQYDIVEMQERARTMSKTKKKGVASVQYDDSYDRMNDRFSNAPPKILVASKYESKVDRRPWEEKVKCFNEKEDMLDLNKIYNDYLEFAGGL